MLLNKLDDQLHHTEKELNNYKQLYASVEQQRVLDDTELDDELQQLQVCVNFESHGSSAKF